MRDRNVPVVLVGSHGDPVRLVGFVASGIDGYGVEGSAGACVELIDLICEA